MGLRYHADMEAGLSAQLLTHRVALGKLVPLWPQTSPQEAERVG